MTPFLALYVKDLKENRTLVFVLMMLSTSLHFYFYLTYVPFERPEEWLVLLLCLPSAMAVIVPPLLLAHSYASEWKGDTHYLALSLPVPKWSIGATKWSAMLTLAGVLFGISTLGMHFIYLSVLGSQKALAAMTWVPAADFWSFAASWYFSITCLLFGVIISMEGVRFAAKRYRNYVAGAFIVGFAYLLSKALNPVLEALAFLGEFRVESIKPDGQVFVQAFPIAFVVFPALGGLLLLLVGLYMLDRFVEI